MKTVILLAYSFPPLSSGGAPVVLNMCRYLPKNDWKVIVVTVEKPKGMMIDQSLLDELPEDLEVIRVQHNGPGTSTPAPRPGKGSENPLLRLAKFIAHNYLLIPDRVITWKKKVLPVLQKIIAEKKPHAIISFGPHHSLHLIALAAAGKTALPVIPWAGWGSL